MALLSASASLVRERRRRGFALPVLLAAVLLLGGLPGAAAQTGSMEYRVKAAMLFNFTRFMVWPEDGRSRLRLCVTGDDPFGPALAGLDGKETRGRELEIRRVQDPSALAHCHMLFIADSAHARIPGILARVARDPVVTVSEHEGFVEQGGTVELRVMEGKVRFEINADAAEHEGITISSKLLRLARRVHGGGAP